VIWSSKIKKKALGSRKLIESKNEFLPGSLSINLI
jgi:hypothetical protein